MTSDLYPRDPMYPAMELRNFNPSTGKLIQSFEEYSAVMRAPRHIGLTELEWNDEKHVQVSTVHLVTDMSFGRQGSPVLWETMMFGDLDAVPANNDLEGFQIRYDSEANARKGHRHIVNVVTVAIVDDGYAVTTREITSSLLRKELA